MRNVKPDGDADGPVIFTCPKCRLQLPIRPHEFPVHCRCGNVSHSMSFGLGDAVASVAKWLGFKKPCVPCKKRRKDWNWLLPFK